MIEQLEKMVTSTKGRALWKNVLAVFAGMLFFLIGFPVGVALAVGLKAAIIVAAIGFLVLLPVAWTIIGVHWLWTRVRKRQKY